MSMESVGVTQVLYRSTKCRLSYASAPASLPADSHGYPDLSATEAGR
jgi:hypothetical protein